jgi:hypothetical protein
LAWIGRRLTREVGGFARRTHQQQFWARQIKRRFGQQQGNGAGQEKAFARELQFVIVRRMGLVLMMVVMITSGLVSVMMIARMMRVGDEIAAMMHLGQKMNPNVIYLEREQSRRQQANPPPTRIRAGGQRTGLA